MNEERFPGEIEWHEQRASSPTHLIPAEPPPYADNSGVTTTPAPAPTTATADKKQEKPKEQGKERCAKKVCGCCGIPVYIHWLFPIIFIIDIANSFRYPEPFLFLALSICLNSILYVTVLLHELGHCLAAHMLGGNISHILLWPLGGLAYVSHGGTPRNDMLIALAGPLTHIPQALAYGFILGATFGFENLMYYTIPMSKNFGANLLRGCLRMQVLLFCFNLLIPAYPLDGGRIFASFLIRHFDLRKTALIIICTTVPIGLALGVWAVVEGLSLSFIVALWILWQAWLIFRLRKKNKLEEHSLFLTARKEPNDAGSGPI